MIKRVINDRLYKYEHIDRLDHITQLANGCYIIFVQHDDVVHTFISKEHDKAIIDIENYFEQIMNYPKPQMTVIATKTVETNVVYCCGVPVDTDTMKCVVCGEKWDDESFEKEMSKHL